MDADRNAPNPYAAPTAPVEDIEPAVSAQPAFFPVSLLKLSIMSLATFGLYEVYWFYKNWKAVRALTGRPLNAAIRTAFYPLTAFFLFRQVNEQGAKVDAGIAIAAGPLASALLLLSVSWRLPDPYWLVSLAGFLPLLPVQSAINRLNRKVAPEADSNTRFSGWNVVGIALGGLLLALSILGLYFGER